MRTAKIEPDLRLLYIIPEIDYKFGLDATDVRGKNNTKMFAPRLGAIRT